MKKTGYALFIISAIVFIIAHYADNQIICNITKPIPIVILILFIKWNSAYNRLISLGLIFSLAGDVILESFKWFVPGLVAFLIAHIFYIFSFIKKSAKPSLLISVPFFSYGLIMFLFLSKSLGNMTIPVAFYILIITSMLWRAFVQRKSDHMAIWALCGAVLFTVSDSVLAISKFNGTFYLASLIVMITYWGAQFLIYWSTIDKDKKMI